MALGGTIRGKKTTLRLPIEADLETYNRWMADMRVRRAHRVWHEPAMPATWKERFKEIAKVKESILWSIDTDGKLVGFALGRLWTIGNAFDVIHFLIDPAEWRKGYGFDAALALHRYLFDYLDLRLATAELRADNAAALKIVAKLGYIEFAHGHEVHYRDGAYVDEIKLRMDKETWQERWSTEREYPPLAADATR
ncbi:MAG: GNAT family N-acetyltransferase [Chloroflexi bacterium]|nr:MAG: GNAT family N-acetyltransferase [Chloroflexota bacterium]